MNLIFIILLWMLFAQNIVPLWFSILATVLFVLIFLGKSGNTNQQ